MVAATKWEYATFHRGGTDYVAFHWSQGERLISGARTWFKTALKEGESHSSYLSLKLGGRGNEFVVAFMGANGWEMVGFQQQGAYSDYWFKRPFGNADIAG